jgi:5-methylthioadenosine/S-adenosylhomocysteine deaminase
MSDRIGSLEPGKRADIVIRTTEVAESQPGLYPIQTLASRGKSVDTVIVDGRIVVRRGRSTLVDEGVVYATARERAIRVAQAIDLRTESRWPVL